MKLINKMPDITKAEIERIDKLTRELICNELRDKMLYLEKYSTTKDGNKKTYVIVPFNHLKYQFPYNLEDRIKNRIGMINKIVDRHVEITTKKMSDKKELYYVINFKNEKFITPNSKELEKIGCVLDKDIWSLIIE